MSMNFSDLFGGGGVKPWVSGATYAAGKVAMSPADNFQLYVRVVAGAGTTDPSADTANWKPFEARAIKSIQRGTVTLTSASASVTVASVATQRSELRFLGCSISAAANVSELAAGAARIALTNQTTITATRGNVSSTTVVSWELTEYH